MRTGRKKNIILIILIYFVLLLSIGTDGKAYYNAPLRHTRPHNIFEYYFENHIDRPQPYPDDEKTDYGTHDWIADGALRLLYNEPQGQGRWDWLLHNLNDPSPDDTLFNNPDYALGNRHNAVRSYIYYLLGTQWPDGVPPARGGSDPTEINFPEEGEVFRERDHNLGAWMDRAELSNYYYDVTQDPEIPYIIFEPSDPDYSGSADTSPQRAPHMARNFGRLAVDYLARQAEDGTQTVTKPELASFYLGIMTHYIADAACPPHLLPSRARDDEGNIVGEWYSRNPKYESWFERQATQVTSWDIAHPGPFLDFFTIDTFLIGRTPTPIPSIPPGDALVECARNSIATAFGEVGGGQDGTSPLGLYVITDHADVIRNWVWGDETGTHVIEDGITYEDYYNKVELLLNYAVYYTACAMKWVHNEVQKRGGMDPDYIAANPQVYQPTPVPDLDPHPPALDEQYQEQGEISVYYGARTAAIMALAVIPMVLITIGISVRIKKPIPVE